MPGYAFRLMLKAILVNHVKMLFGDPDVDRVGRARGNRKALYDMVFGRIQPKRILTLES
jgi:hypothetical protein